MSTSRLTWLAIAAAVLLSGAALLEGQPLTTATFGRILMTSSLSPAASANEAALTVAPTIVEAASGTHARLSGVEFTAPTITVGAGAVTNAQTLYISAAPSAAGATNRALWVDAGDVALDGAVTIGGALSVTTAETLYLEAALCQNATTVHAWSLPVTNPAVAACVTGTNVQRGVLDFADSADLSAERQLRLPADFTSTINAAIEWHTTATTGSVVWQLQTICVADAETGDPTYNTASTVIDAAKGTTLQFNTAAITTVTITGCAASETLFLKVRRDAAHASDTLAATARLVGLELTLRRART